MGKIKGVFKRIYLDYFMPSRLKEYEKILQNIVNEGFECITYSEYVSKLKKNTLEDKKYFILRHDIDTDLATTRRFFKIEKKMNVKASYYFRQTTINVKLMREINAYGSEASYHFEEIATFCKKNHIKNKQKVIENISEIRQMFKNNFITLEQKLGYKLITVASHGDFVNRKLNTINNVITDDDNLRQELGILAETYDKDVFAGFDTYVSDCKNGYISLLDEHLKTDKFICFLTHPRQWRTNFYVNTKDNLKRFVEGIVW